MREKLQKRVRGWLAAERQSAEAADSALREVFLGLPAEPVPFGFADQVLARAGISATTSDRRSSAWIWFWRSALTVSLLLGALSIVVLPSTLLSLLAIINPGRLVDFGVGMGVDLVQRLGIGLVFWRVMAMIGSALSSAITSPQVLTVLVLSMLMSAVGLRVFHGLLVSERSSHYVGAA